MIFFENNENSQKVMKMFLPKKEQNNFYAGVVSVIMALSPSADPGVTVSAHMPDGCDNRNMSNLM